jgi:S-DNA-T family DNA segregation ATPase FtsK/SpoIIIE
MPKVKGGKKKKKVSKGGARQGRPQRAREKGGLPRNIREICSALLLVGGILLAISIYSEMAGPVGRGIDVFFSYLLGKMRFAIPPIFVLSSLLLLLGIVGGPIPENRLVLRLGWVEITGAVVILMGVCASFHLGNPPEMMFSSRILKNGGGVIGAGISWPLAHSLGKVGAIVLVSGMLLVGFFMLTGLSISYGIQRRVERRRAALEERRKRRRAEKERLAALRAEAEIAEAAKAEAFTRGTEGEVHGMEGPGIRPAQGFKTRIVETKGDMRKGEEAAAVVGGEASQQLAMEMKGIDLARSKYKLPPLNLLRKMDQSASISRKSINESIRVVEKTLKDFEVDAAVTRVTRGPTVTRFEVELGSGVKVNRVVGLLDDIAYALASPDIRILTPIPGKSAIGIEVPNQERDLVTLGDILSTAEAQSVRTPLRAALGKDVAGQPVVVNLADMPHLLLAGATGSGKSCCINTLIMSILFTATPEEVKFLMIDPKYVELSHYNGIPHLLAPVINDPKKASAALAWVVREMEERYKILSLAGAKNIDIYQREIEQGLQGELDEEGKPLFKPMSYYLVVIDELADLMMVAPAEVEESIARIAQMARAVGIHLVVATQRPSVDVVTGLIKANIPSRVAFTVASQADSRVILDTGGAEKLVGHGDMLFLPAGKSKPIRVQGAYVSEKEIEATVAFIKRQRPPEYNQVIIEETRQETGVAGKTDALLEKATEIVVKSGFASASFLQRKLGVGYARAARLIDLLEDKGIVGGYEGSKPRAVLITPEELERMKREGGKGGE